MKLLHDELLRSNCKFGNVTRLIAACLYYVHCNSHCFASQSPTSHPSRKVFTVCDQSVRQVLFLYYFVSQICSCTKHVLLPAINAPMKWD